MSKLNCEAVCIAATAMTDGCISELSSDQIEAHLAECSVCRREVGQLRALSTLLDAQVRRPRTEKVWKLVERRLPAAPPPQNASRVWYSFLLLGMLLFGYRIVELIPDRDFGLLFKLVPLVLVISAFIYLKENPFKINSELRLEGE